MKAELLELNAAIRTSDRVKREAAVTKSEVSLTRLQGRATQLLLSTLSAFPDPRVSVACDKLRDRVLKTNSLLRAEPPPTEKLFRTALDWIDAQAEVLLKLAAPLDKQPGHRREQPMWVGWGKDQTRRWAKKAEELSNVDRASPWEPEVRLFLNGMSRRSRDAEDIKRFTLERIRTVRCPEHERAPHITFLGSIDNFTIEIQACCEALVATTKNALPGLSSNGARATKGAPQGRDVKDPIESDEGSLPKFPCASVISSDITTFSRRK
jgi:hypothetical protein